KTYFVDTSYWIARSDPKDQLHAKATALGRELGPDIRLVTTELVLVEWLNWTSKHGAEARRELVHQILRIEETDDILVVRQDEYMFRSVLMDYGKYADKGWSFTDCTSFYVMERSNIKDALTHDRHFEQAGFRALLRTRAKG